MNRYETYSIEDMGIEEEYKNFLRSNGNEQTTITTYWSHVKSLPGFDLLGEDAIDISNRLVLKIRKDKEITAAVSFINFLYKHGKETGVINENNLDQYREKVRTIIGQLKSQREMKHAELDTQSDYNTVKDHYIRKNELIELLEKLEPERAKFIALLYFGGFRYKELKLVKPEHFRKPQINDAVGDYGGVRIQKNRSKSKFTRTVSFRHEAPYEILTEQNQKVERNQTSWTDREARTWNNVIFPEISQSKLNYRLGKKTEENGKIKYYGLFSEITGKVRTLHSLRHTRITDLVADTDLSVGEVRQRSGHSITATTDSYKENSVENPKTLERYCKEENIDLMSLITS